MGCTTRPSFFVRLRTDAGEEHGTNVARGSQEPGGSAPGTRPQTEKEGGARLAPAPEAGRGPAARGPGTRTGQSPAAAPAWPPVLPQPSGCAPARPATPSALTPEEAAAPSSSLPLQAGDVGLTARSQKAAAGRARCPRSAVETGPRASRPVAAAVPAAAADPDSVRTPRRK